MLKSVNIANGTLKLSTRIDYTPTRSRRKSKVNETEEGAWDVRPCTNDDSKIWWIWNPATVAMV